LLQLNPDWFYLSGTGLPGYSRKIAVKRVCVCVYLAGVGRDRETVGGADLNYENVAGAELGLEMLRAAETLQLTVDHDRQTSTQRLTFLHAAHAIPPTVIVNIISFPMTHSLFHSKTFLFCKSFSLQPFLFFFRTDYMIPQILLILLSTSVFYLLVFLFYTFSCCFREVD